MDLAFRIALLILVFSHQAQALEFGLGLGVQNFAYREELTLPSKSTENATYPSVIVDLGWRWRSLTKLSVAYEITPTVNSLYDGATLSGGQPVLALNPVSFNGYEGLFQLGLASRLAVYLGFGYRFWNRFLSGGSGYRELYWWNYYPVGVKFLVHRGQRSQLWLDLSARRTDNAFIRVITSETIAGGQDSEMRLGARTGYRGSFNYRAPLANRRSYEISGYFERSELGQSAVVANSTLAPVPGTGIYEPSSIAVTVGLKAMWELSL